MKDYSGHVMVYFKDRTRFAYMAVSRDGYNVSRPKHGAVTYLTAYELNASTKHWGVTVE